MELAVGKILFRVLKIIGITAGSLLLLLFLLPYLFPGTVARKIKGWTNSSINGELNFSSARLSFFNHFPALTLTLHNFTLKGSAPFRQDTLIAADEVSLGINLNTVFDQRISINKIFLTRASVHIEVNEKGEANYNVYKSTPAQTPANPNDSSGASLRIESIVIENSHIVYDDRSLPLFMEAKGFNYSGKGDLSKAIFDLSTHATIDSFDFYFDHIPYVLSKRVKADLVTKINTHSLSLHFEKNDLRINTLPVHFTGQLNFLENGYDMDFELNSGKTGLYDVFTALPPEYAGWLAQTAVKGNAEMGASLKGRYDAKTGTMPNLEFDMKVEGGYISYRQKEPVKNLFFSFRSGLPGLNPDSLLVNIDSLYFNIGSGYFDGNLHIKGVTAPYIKAAINAQMDIGKLDQALGIKPFDLEGKYELHFFADGKYATGIKRAGIRRKETVITSIPAFKLRSSLQNGYFKYAALPKAVTDISFNIDASCPDNNYRHTVFSVENIHASVLNNYLKGSLKFSLAKDFPVSVRFQSAFNLADIKEFYPMDSTSLAGELEVNILSDGKYNPAKKLFPVTRAVIHLQDGLIQTKYYPHPIDKILVDGLVSNTNGTMKNMEVSLRPVSFEFEGHRFILRAELQNFNNLKYRIVSAGELDIGRVYKVFSRKGYDVKGFIRTNLSLQGLQSDASEGHYDKLLNSGTLELRDISLSSDLFPKPFLIHTGLFRFNQDKVWFDRFHVTYGSSNVSLKGYLSDIINYALKDTAALRGNFALESNNILVDEFMAFADNKTTAASGAPTSSSPASPGGVIIVPSNLDLQFTASVKKLGYHGIRLDSLNGTMKIDSGRIRLNQLSFKLIGAPVMMDAVYGSITPEKAFFDYHINARHLDVKRAYNEIKIFRDLATSASKAEGIISLDYRLSGLLDDNMRPVYASLKGGGLLSLQQVKLKGLKLFSSVGKATKRDSISNPDLSEVDIRSTIANSIITIARTKMRVAGFRPRVEGQVGFNGRLNLKFRLGLPPFGIIGIPMTITGSEDHPEIHFRKGRETDELREQEE